jgi:isopenicillin N synthase-like dioxygenase
MPWSNLPIIDIGPMFKDDLAERRAVAARLGAAAREIGFFYIVNHGVPHALRDAVFAASAAFFAQDEAAKQSILFSAATGNRGYVPMKGESLDPTKPADLKEAFNIGFDLPPDDPELLAAARFRAANLWPGMPGFKETMLDYFAAMMAAGRALHRAFALDLGEEETLFDDKIDRPLATLRLLHYPPHPGRVDPGQLGAGEHTDYGNVTILATDDAGGLEVRRRDGEWLKAPTVPGAFVCNIGDCLMRWTNDTYVSTPHRVVNPAGRERFSVAFFLDPNPDAMVECLPGCGGPGNPPRYPPVRGDDYLQSRLEATYKSGGLM